MGAERPRTRNLINITRNPSGGVGAASSSGGVIFSLLRRRPNFFKLRCSVLLNLDLPQPETFFAPGAGAVSEAERPVFFVRAMGERRRGAGGKEKGAQRNEIAGGGMSYSAREGSFNLGEDD